MPGYGWFPTLYPGWSPSTYWIISALASLLLFGSVLAHELAHSLVARARGLPVKDITLCSSSVALPTLNRSH